MLRPPPACLSEAYRFHPNCSRRNSRPDTSNGINMKKSGTSTVIRTRGNKTKKRAGHRRYRPRRSQYRIRTGQQDVPDARDDAAGEVKRQITDVSQTVVDGVSEYPQKDHVSYQVCPSGVHEHAGEELIYFGPFRLEEVCSHAGRIGFRALEKYEYEHVSGHQCVIYERCMLESPVSADWNHVTLFASLVFGVLRDIVYSLPEVRQPSFLPC